MSAPSDDRADGRRRRPRRRSRSSDLCVDYRVRGVWREVLRGISFTVERGGSYGLVGESGCGKSTAALAAIRYLPRNGRVSSGSITVAGEDVLALRGRDLQRYRGDVVSMVYQNPGTALNPSIRVGKQLAEVFTARGSSKAEAHERSLGDAAPGADRRPDLGHGALSAPALGRHAAARRDRDGARRRSCAADPRRADDRPRRDRRGRGARPHHEAAGRVPHRRAVHQPQPRRDPQDVLARRRAVRRRDGRGGQAEQVLHDPRHPYTVGLLRCIPRGGVRKDHGRLDTIPGYLPPIGADLPGCVFADRCALAEDICHEREAARRSRSAAATSAAASSTSARRSCRARWRPTSRAPATSTAAASR